MLEQFGGATGDLAAAVQYSIQGSTAKMPRARIFSRIEAEELSTLKWLER
jgi:Mn-containing catalase